MAAVGPLQKKPLHPCITSHLPPTKTYNDSFTKLVSARVSVLRNSPSPPCTLQEQRSKQDNPLSTLRWSLDRSAPEGFHLFSSILPSSLHPRATMSHRQSPNPSSPVREDRAETPAPSRPPQAGITLIHCGRGFAPWEWSGHMASPHFCLLVPSESTHSSRATQREQHRTSPWIPAARTPARRPYLG